MRARGVEFVLRNDNVDVRRLADVIEYMAELFAIPEPQVYRLNLALDELITNIIAYGYPGERAGRIDVEMRRRGDWIDVQLADDAIAFDPFSIAAPDLDTDLEERPIGGLGIHFVRTLIDEVSYRREGDQNVVTLTLLVPIPGAETLAPSPS
jgi:serine/threonine-protein kinase RsbW